MDARDAAAHGKIVLGMIIGHPSMAALEYALRCLQPAHFADPVQAVLWQMLERYREQAHGVLPPSALADALRSKPPGVIQKYGEYYTMLAVMKPSADEFRWSVQQLRELHAERRTGEVLASGMEILRHELKEGRDVFRGHADARAWVQSAFAGVERELSQSSAPEGDIRAEGAAVLQAYADRKAAAARGSSGSVPTGIPDLDELLGGGAERGELDLVVAFSSVGKTSFLVQWGWHAVTALGLSVTYFTTETLRPQVHNKVLSRHSRLEKFGLPAGLNSRDIKAGTLSPAGEEALQAVVADFGQSPGRFNVVQVPRGATLDTVEARLARDSSRHPADLVIIDSLQLLHSGVRRQSLWEETSVLLKDAKQLAAGYLDGRGVPVLSPWQVSKGARIAARERGYYLKEDLSDTQEAFMTPDVLLSLMDPKDYDGSGVTTLEACLLKNRDGEARYGENNGLPLHTEYATCFFDSRGGGGSDLLSFGMEESSLG